jgi:hypothetical protein
VPALLSFQSKDAIAKISSSPISLVAFNKQSAPKSFGADHAKFLNQLKKTCRAKGPLIFGLHEESSASALSKNRESPIAISLCVSRKLKSPTFRHACTLNAAANSTTNSSGHRAAWKGFRNAQTRSASSCACARAASICNFDLQLRKIDLQLFIFRFHDVVLDWPT